MSDPVTVVTGGGRGIGESVSRKLAAQGHLVVLNYVQDRASAEAVVKEIQTDGGVAFAVQGDISRESDILRIFKTADTLGAVTGLVNNAGIVDKTMRVEDMSMNRLTRMFAINVVGQFLCAREAIRRMSTRHGGKGGSIVNLGSAASKLGSPDEYVDYAASKGAIDTFTVGLALEVAEEGVRVNAVRPGITDTRIHASGGNPHRARDLAAKLPLKRAATAEEVANAVVWLMSDEASYTTGAILDVSGGRAILP